MLCPLNDLIFIFYFCREFVHLLRQNNKEVYLITGGFDCLIEPVAIELGIPLENLFANKLHFYFNGKKKKTLRKKCDGEKFS